MARRKRPVSFRTSEVSHVVGATYSQLVYWDKTGLVKPSVKPASGRGSRRLYSIEDIFELKILVKLLDSSLPLQRTADTVELPIHTKPIKGVIIFCSAHGWEDGLFLRGLQYSR